MKRASAHLPAWFAWWLVAMGLSLFSWVALAVWPRLAFLWGQASGVAVAIFLFLGALGLKRLGRGAPALTRSTER